MHRSLELLLGAATLVPLLLIGYSLLRFLGVFVGILTTDVAQPGEVNNTFHGLIGVMVTTVGVVVALLGVYLWHLLVHRARREVVREVLPWVAALVLVPVVAMPIYWFTRIWPERKIHQGRAGTLRRRAASVR
jgi:hypothetical protein